MARMRGPFWHTSPSRCGGISGAAAMPISGTHAAACRDRPCPKICDKKIITRTAPARQDSAPLRNSVNAAEGLACPAGFGLGPGAVPRRVWGRYWAIPGRAHAAFCVRGGRRPLRDSTLTQGSRCHMAACRQQSDGAGVRPGGPGRPRTPPPKRRSFTLFLMRGICGTRSGAPRRTPARGRRR